MDVQKFKAGAMLVGFVLVVMVGWQLWKGDKPMAGTCETSTVGVTLMANSLKQGTAAGIAIAASSGVLANAACKQLMEKLHSNPTEPQPVKVTTPGGQVVEDQITREELTREPPTTTQGATTGQGNWDTGLEPILACINSYETAILRQWCFEGKIQPLGQ